MGSDLSSSLVDRFTVSSMMMEFKQETKVVESRGTPRMESGRLYVETRIPKVDDKGVQEGAEAETVTVENQMVACGICGKLFRSEKALNGHSRVHVQNQRERMNKGWKAATRVDLASAEGKRSMCAVCGSTFRSMNALYGHMRLHPDRGWRGVQPPVTIAGWSVTRKRGRRRIAPVDSGSVVDLCPSRKRLEEKGDGIRSFEGEADETKKRASVTIPEQHSVPDKQKLRELGKINSGGSSKGSTTDVVNSVSAEKCTCRCNESFTSHQALDDHRSSCTKSNQNAGRAAPSPQPQAEYSEFAHSWMDFDLDKVPIMAGYETNAEALCVSILASLNQLL